MALIDPTGTILVDDANLLWRRIYRPDGISGLGELGELGKFDWEGFGSAGAGIGASVAAIIAASKSPRMPEGGIGAYGTAGGSQAGFHMTTGTMMMLGLGAVLLFVMMRK